MNTPIYDFITKYSSSETARLHMPGAKGKTILGPEPMDITEIKGADELYAPDGIIAQSEKNASELFGTAITAYSTEGSSHCIRSMIMLAAQLYIKNEEKPFVLAARNVHKSFVFACAIAGVDAEFVYPTTGEINSVAAGIISPEELKKALVQLKTEGRRPFAVYITSPDYLGGIADVRGLKEVCREYDLPLLVDNAHGAYLHFLKEKLHPMDLGADMCADSAHKTLPVLTGGAYLHIKNEITDIQTVKSIMEISGTTSPSYLIMSSLDRVNRLLAEGLAEEYDRLACRLDSWKDSMRDKGIPIMDGDRLKLVINAAKLGMSGNQLGDALRAGNVEAEFCDHDYVVLMVTPYNSEDDLEKTEEVLLQIKKLGLPALKTKSVVTKPLMKATDIRNAVFSKQQLVCIEEAVGRICGIPVGTCPPAVPIAVSGERITEEIIPCFKEYGIKKISVIC